MQTVTLHSEDFKTVHNTLCELRSIVGDMQQSMVKVGRLEAVIQSFEQGLADAYRQDSEAFDHKHDYYTSVRQEMKFRSIWSMFEIDDFYTPHPFPSDSFVVYDQHWGDGRKHYPVMGPNWIDLWSAADLAIRESGDDHHIFVEGFRLKNGNELHMGTGS